MQIQVGEEEVRHATRREGFQRDALLTHVEEVEGLLSKCVDEEEMRTVPMT